MRKPKIYLETTIWNFIFADDAPDKRDITKLFFQQLEQYEAYISLTVLGEISRTKNQAKLEQLLKLIDIHQPIVLESTPEAERLAQAYIYNGVLTAKHRIDAEHIAITAVFDLDIIVSWNMGDIVRLKTRQGVNAVNLLKGYRELEVITPQEVTQYEWD